MKVSTEVAAIGALERTKTFGEVLVWLKAGGRATRLGWNGKGMTLNLQVPDEHSKMTLPYLYIEYPVNPDHHVYPQGCRVPWLASQADVLADDWLVLS